MPEQEYYKTQGDDGQWYTTQAASPEEAQKKFASVKKQAASQPAAPATPTGQAPAAASGMPRAYGFTPRNMIKNVGEGLKGVAKGSYDLGKDLLSNPNWLQYQPEGKRPSTFQKFVGDPADAELQKAKEDLKSHRLWEAAGHGAAAMIPVLGPVGAQLGEQAGKGDIGGALGQGIGMYGIPKLGGKLVAKTAKELTPETLQKTFEKHAAELNTKVLKQANEDSRDYKTSAALQVAQEQIVASARELPGRIEQARVQHGQNVEGLAKSLDQKGTTVDIQQDLKPILSDVAQIANARGKWDATLRNQVHKLLSNVMTQTDLKTGQQVPRPLSKLKVSEALELTRGLEDLSAFGGDKAPAAINNLARRIRGAINDRIAQSGPEGKQIQAERAGESKLIVARDAARANYTKILNDRVSVGKGIIYGSGGTIAAYLGLKALGAPFMTAVGSVVTLRALAQSTKSRTFRAALYARAAKMLERAGAPTGANAGPTGPNAGPLARGGPQGPQGPQPVVNKALTGRLTLPGQMAPGPPFARSSVVSTNPAPTPLTRGTMLPEKSSRAKAGSGDYVKGKTTVARSNTTPSTTVEEGAKKPPETDSKSKAMLDRLDTLYERQANPKSGADRNAIEREITEVKKILSGDASGSERSRINKHIADRERLASKREQARQTAPAGQTSGAGEAVSQTASPELRALALDAGYKKLATYEGGAQMVKTLRETSKAMAKLDPTYDEVEKLTEILDTMKEIGDLDTK